MSKRRSDMGVEGRILLFVAALKRWQRWGEGTSRKYTQVNTKDFQPYWGVFNKALELALNYCIFFFFSETIVFGWSAMEKRRKRNSRRIVGSARGRRGWGDANKEESSKHVMYRTQSGWDRRKKINWLLTRFLIPRSEAKPKHHLLRLTSNKKDGIPAKTRIRRRSIRP